MAYARLEFYVYNKYLLSHSNTGLCNDSIITVTELIKLMIKAQTRTKSTKGKEVLIQTVDLAP